jgi:DNA-binding GntR family transcriptional regulator
MRSGKTSILEVKESKAESVYREIKQDILYDNLQPGEPLFERRLCDHYGVSRTPVREALRRLAIENLVVMTPSMGAYVSKITSDLILEIYNIREVLEGLACRLYATRITDQSKQELRVILNDLVKLMKAKKYHEALKLDLAIHEKIKRECGSPKLIEMLSPIADQIARITRATHYDLAWAEETVAIHTRICEALIDGRAEDAENAMREHIAVSRRRHIATL